MDVAVLLATGCLRGRLGMDGDGMKALVGFAPWMASLVLAGLVAASGCSEDESGGSGESGGNGEGSGNDLVEFATLQFDPEFTSVSQAVAVGNVTEYVVTIRNSGKRALLVESIVLDYVPVSADEAQPAFTLTQVRGCAAAGCPNPTVWSAEAVGSFASGERPEVGQNGEPFTFLEAVVTFQRPATAADRTASLVVRSNSDGSPERTHLLTAEVGNARIEVVPLIVDFDLVPAAATEERTIGINNSGSDVLVIDRIEFQGSDFYKLLVGEEEYVPGGSVTFDPPVQVPVNTPTQFKVTFAPLDGQPATATLRIFSNDPNSPTNGVVVELRGNTSGPCIQLNPSTSLSFGAKPVGQLSVLPVQVRNCGNAPLEIYDIYLDPATSSADFQIDKSEVPGFEGTAGPTLEAPLVIPVNTQVDIPVSYVPDAVNPKDNLGQPIPDLGTLVFQNNTFDQFRELEVRGVGVDVICPTAVIFIAEGEEVIPQTELNLFGDQSASPAGEIVEYKWSVQAPVGSVSVFVPADNVVNPKFEVNIAGTYVFELKVKDETGKENCEPELAEVAVIPNEAIHVELLWSTPNDPDPTDEGQGKGSDLDLHFVHPFAQGPDLDGDGAPDGWFDDKFDTFWHNPQPNWAILAESADDDPSLDRDDTDGGGPENLNLSVPEEGRSYRVGVHYWNDHKFGDSLATVRVYIFDSLVWERPDVLLTRYDMWEACTIDWPSGNVTPVLLDGALKITPDYINPFFYQPETNQ
jgi:hypothetical protein